MLLVSRHFFDFAVADHPRYQLMNERIVPGFEPSRGVVRAIGPRHGGRAGRIMALGDITDEDFTIWVSILGGLINQHYANDQGGTRIRALLDRAVDMWADAVGLPASPSNTLSRREPPMSTTTPSRDDLVRPRIPRPLAMQLAATEYARMADTFAGLGPDDWTSPTDCTLWDVRQLACHMVGMANMVTTPFEMKRQQRKAADDRRGPGRRSADRNYRAPGQRTRRLDHRRHRRRGEEGRAQGRSRPPDDPWLHAEATVPGQAAGERPRRELGDRLPQRRHPHPRPVDAPDGHRQGGRTPSPSSPPTTTE